MYDGKVIDFHVHVGEFSNLREDIQKLLMMKDDDREFDVKKMFSNPCDLMEYLVKSGVEKAVILGEDGPGTNFHITSKFVCDFKEKSPLEYQNMLVCLGCLNPNSIDISPIEKYQNDIKLGICGYKLYPSDHNFDPLTKSLFDVYRSMEKNKHILMFHTGESAQIDSVSNWQNPLDYKIIAETFPDLVIILSHGGNKKYASESFNMMINYKNVYMDTGFINPSILMEMYPEINHVVNKILFASDMPGGVSSLKNYIAEFRQMKLSDEDIEKILYSNAKKILDRFKEID
ncbi:MAG: amidohydrolase family protein [Oscillospiraceae bacterium]|nr:amidohydrolase family protein [Oscillospiraceae bacterium]